ncbi:MAG: hypothetical protein JNM21_00555 [Taibaiella sp.]|nr:hypothetical protein [Taibaiella sp.]
MKKITCKILLILFAVLLTPLLSRAQVKPDLDNEDSLVRYLKMDKHPDYPEASAFYIQNIVRQNIDPYGSDIQVDIALKIFKVNDVAEYVNFILPKFTQGIKLKEFKVRTYNLENGLLQTRELDKKSLQETKIKKGKSIQTISAAHAKDGSIVHYQFTIHGSAAGLFLFQDELPVHYAEFTVKTLKDTKIKVKESINTPFKVFTDKPAFFSSPLPSIAIADRQRRYIVYTWIKRDLAPFKEEIFTSKQKPEQLSIDFYHIEQNIHSEDSEFQNYTWKTYNTVLYQQYSSAFTKNNFLAKHLPAITGKEQDTLKLAQNLFKYVQDSFNVGNDLKTKDIEKLVKDKEGNQDALNMLLCALYRQAGLTSDLVLVSLERKRPLSPGRVTMSHTTIAVRVMINGVAYLCAPDQKKLPFGYLPYAYYNGYTRLINKEGGSIVLSPELAKNKIDVAVTISPVDTLHRKFKIEFRKSYGIYGSASERERYRKDTAAYHDFFKKRLEALSPDLNTSNYAFKAENSENIEQPLVLAGAGEIDLGDHPGILFLDPFLQKIYDGQNPFQQMKDRDTDVEMDFCYTLNYNFRLHLNPKMSVEELPSRSTLHYASPAAIMYSQGASYNPSDNSVEVKYTYDIIPVFYAPEEVADLNAFYTEVMKTINQKLLLNKK